MRKSQEYDNYIVSRQAYCKTSVSHIIQTNPFSSTFSSRPYSDPRVLVAQSYTFGLIPASRPCLFSTTTQSRCPWHSGIWSNKHSVLLAGAFTEKSRYSCGSCLVEGMSLKDGVVVGALRSCDKMAMAIASHPPRFELGAHLQQTMIVLAL